MVLLPGKSIPACFTPAGLVRLLRKVFSQLSAKNREFVTHSLKFEKNAAQQVRKRLLHDAEAWSPEQVLFHLWLLYVADR
jgi:hypothetical protein